MDPNQYPRRILVVVSGMSPQVLTETLWALACTDQPRFVPTEAHLISTADGIEHARLNLLEGNAHFKHLCAEYGLDPGMLDASRLHMIRAADGTALKDIRTHADNEAAADFITGFIRDMTADDDSAVHVSMAGGRKTMGYYAGYALSLYGRDQDRLSHVLVSEGFEGHRDFYYPTRATRPIYREHGITLDARDARIDLAMIPFVRMRDQLPEKLLKANALLDGRRSFSQTVEVAARGYRAHILEIDLPNLALRLNGEEHDEPYDIGAANFSLLAWLADRAARGLPPLSMLRDIDVDKGGDGLATGQDYARFCQRLEARDETLLDRAGGHYRLPGLAKVGEAFAKSGFQQRTDFESKLSRLNKALRDQLGERLAEQFAPRNLGKKGDANYGFVDFDDHIRLIPLP